MSKIHVFSSPEAAFLVNSFLIETQHGLVLVDTQFLTSAARQLCDAIKALGRPLLAVVITHPHPDHFNGTALIDETWPGLPIYATATTTEVIKATEADKRAAWTPVYGEDYPRRTVLPNRVVPADGRVVVDGLTLVVDDLGAGESADITVVHLPASNALIASDLLYNRVHPWLAEGRTQQWLAQINTVQRRYAGASAVYAGHGPAGDLGALEEQASYLRTFRDLVKQHVADLTQATANQKAAVVKAMEARYAGYPLAMLLGMNVDGVAKELAG